MKLAVLATTRNPLRQPFDGGQESHTATLIRALRRLGHQVRLYAAPGTDADLADELVPYRHLPELSRAAADAPRQPEPDFLSAQHNLLGAVAHLIEHADEIDLLHNQTLNHLPLAMSPVITIPMVTTLHTPPFPWLEMGVRLAAPHVEFVAVSNALAAQWTSLDRPAWVIPNGVDVSAFPAGPGGPHLVWVGRIVPEKGPDLAIAAARAAGRTLQLIGPVADRAWFDATIAPLLGPDIRHLGHLDHAETATVVGASSALLMAPRWDEPFGLVTVEAALTGTPVVTIARGGLPEVVGPDIGVVVSEGASDGDTAARLAAAVPRAERLNRHRVREHAIAHFAADRMARQYQALFGHLVSGPRAA